jgi:hypothetical protein
MVQFGGLMANLYCYSFKQAKHNPFHVYAISKEDAIRKYLKFNGLKELSKKIVIERSRF